MVVYRKVFDLSENVLNILRRISENKMGANKERDLIHAKIQEYKDADDEHAYNRTQAKKLTDVPGLVNKRIKGDSRKDLFTVLDAIFKQSLNRRSDIATMTKARIKSVVEEHKPNFQQAIQRLARNETIQIGRKPSIQITDRNDMSFPHEKLVSERHCAITRTCDGSLLLIDLGSKNGTYLNGRRITEKEPLSVGDTVTLARSSRETAPISFVIPELT